MSVALLSRPGAAMAAAPSDLSCAPAGRPQNCGWESRHTLGCTMAACRRDLFEERHGVTHVLMSAVPDSGGPAQSLHCLEQR
jgi:hypothetical protein